ncbi:MAG TPA: tetratricopeptide repeat protein [Terriglobia bacterium]|nr:tetratricopeptide repeat protein [Terriglobia bacterium]
MNRVLHFICRDSCHQKRLVLAVLLACLWSTATGLSQENGIDWAAQVRALAAANRFTEAKEVVKRWMEAYPADLDARGWNARLLSWTNHWSEAEAEYRKLVKLAPDDPELQLGLADVLNWQKRYGEALPVLEQTCSTNPSRHDCQLKRARTLQNLGRNSEAQQAYRLVLAQDPSSAEAKAGLEQSIEPSRHEIRIGSDLDLFNFAQNGSAVAAGIRSRLNSRLHSAFSATRYDRFGERVTRFGAESTVRLGNAANLTMGGAAAKEQAVIPRNEAFFEFGKGFQSRGLGPVRGVELLYQQRWLWYRDARVLALSPGAVLYLPKDWTWRFHVSAARNYLTGSSIQWQPSGWTKLSFPITRHIGSHLLFGSGTENFGVLDQIGRFSARTWGSGLNFRLASGQEINTYGSYQSRSEGRSQTSFGVNYGIRF